MPNEATMTVKMTESQYDTFLYMAGLASGTAIKEDCKEAARKIFDLVCYFQKSAIEGFHGSVDSQDANIAAYRNQAWG